MLARYQPAVAATLAFMLYFRASAVQLNDELQLAALDAGPSCAGYRSYWKCKRNFKWCSWETKEKKCHPKGGSETTTPPPSHVAPLPSHCTGKSRRTCRSRSFKKTCRYRRRKCIDSCEIFSRNKRRCQGSKTCEQVGKICVAKSRLAVPTTLPTAAPTQKPIATLNPTSKPSSAAPTATHSPPKLTHEQVEAMFNDKCAKGDRKCLYTNMCSSMQHLMNADPAVHESVLVKIEKECIKLEMAFESLK